MSTELPPRPESWLDWFDFAVEVLELSEDDAGGYATRRLVEDENRARLRDGAAAAQPPLDGAG
jgi:hypothetical protein